MVYMASTPDIEAILAQGELFDLLNIEVNFHGEYFYPKMEMDKEDKELIRKSE